MLLGNSVDVCSAILRLLLLLVVEVDALRVNIWTILREVRIPAVLRSSRQGTFLPDSSTNVKVRSTGEVLRDFGD